MSSLVLRLLLLFAISVYICSCATSSVVSTNSAMQSKMASRAYATGDCKRAIEHYLAILSEFPDDLDSVLRVANCVYLSGDSIGAIEQYRSILRSDPSYNRAWYNLSYIQMEELAKTLNLLVTKVSRDGSEQKKIIEKAIELLDVYDTGDSVLELSR